MGYFVKKDVDIYVFELGVLVYIFFKEWIKRVECLLMVSILIFLKIKIIFKIWDCK